METVLNNLRAVLCDPEGKCCISGSDADRAIVDEALAILAARDAQWQAALAEQEPVAWMHSYMYYPDSPEDAPGHMVTVFHQNPNAPDIENHTPVYTHPAPTNPAAQERAEPVAPAVQADNSELCKTLMQIARNDGAPSWSQRFSLGQAIGLLSATPPAPAQPIDMLLYCPNCGVQHIDAPDVPKRTKLEYTTDANGIRKTVRPPLQYTPTWTNPPHRSHLCHACGCIWRPADVPTNGVEAIKTEGKADTWPAPHNEEVIASAQPSPEPSKPEQAAAPCVIDVAIQAGGLLMSDGEVSMNAEALANLIATLPPASAARERETWRDALESIAGAGVTTSYPGHYGGKLHKRCNSCGTRWCPGEQPEEHDPHCAAQRARAALATKPQAEQEATPPAQTVQDKKGGV